MNMVMMILLVMMTLLVMMILLVMMTRMIKRMVMMMMMRRRSNKKIGVRHRDSFKSLDFDRINKKTFSPNCEGVNMIMVMMIW